MKPVKWGAYRCGPGAALLFALTLLLSPLACLAAEISPTLSLSGFYTLDASRAQGADVYYPSKSEDASSILLKDGKFNTDFSLYGVQADLGLGESLRFTAQVVGSKQTQRRDYSPSLEWAYLSYDLGNDLSLRGGKFKTPLLQGTELRYVGYSRLWVRPLIPSSGAGGFDDYKGLELIKSARLGDYNLRVQGAYGVADHVLDAIDDQDIKLLSARIGRAESWVNLALMHARYDIHTNDRTRMIARDTHLLMGSIETELWFDRTVVNAGHARGIAKVSPDETMTYLSLGYRLENVTPYVLYHNRSMRFTPTPPPGPLPPPGSPVPPGAAPPEKNGTHSTQVLSLGFRYDLGSSHAIKAQVERQFDKDDSDPLLGRQKYSATIFSVVLEGTF